MAIGTLAVNVVAKVGGFLSGMQRGRKEMDSFRSSTRKLAKDVERMNATFQTARRLATGAFAAMGTRSIVSSLLGTAEEIDVLAKASDKLNIATEELIGLTHAAKLSGVESGKFTAALQKMNKHLSEAVDGSKDAEKTFRELGLNVRELTSMAPHQVFGLLADRMNRVSNANDRMRLSMELFGRSGGDMLNVLAEGSEGLKQLTEEAKKLGIVMSREEAAKVEKFNDELDRLKALMGGLKTGFVISVAPAASEVIEGLRIIVSDFKKLSENSTLKLIAKVSGASIIKEAEKGLEEVFTRAIINANIATGTPALAGAAAGQRQRGFEQGSVPTNLDDLTLWREWNQFDRIHDEMEKRDEFWRQARLEQEVRAFGKVLGTGGGMLTSFGFFKKKAQAGAGGLLGGLTGGLQAIGRANAEAQLRSMGDFLQSVLNIKNLPVVQRGQKKQTEAIEQFNALVDPNSVEGFQALRRNLGPAPGKTEQQLLNEQQKTRMAAEKTVEALHDMLRKGVAVISEGI